MMQLLHGGCISLILSGVGRSLRLIAGDGVHYLQLKIRILYQQVRMLAVYINELVRQTLQLLQGHQTVIHKRPALPVRIQLPPDNGR